MTDRPGTRTGILLLAGIAALLGLLPASAPSADDRDDPVTVRVGLYDNPPKIYMSDSGVASGFWPALTAEIARLENWDIKYVSGSWSEGLSRLETGEIDVMPDVAFTGDRAEKYLFSDTPVLMSWTRLYIHKDNRTFQSIRDLEGGKVAALANSVNLEGPGGFREMVQSFNLDLEIVELPDYHEVFEAIRDGRVTAGITNRNFGNKNAARYGVKKTPILFQPVNMTYAFPRDIDPDSEIVEAINRHLKDFQETENSIYFKLLSHYFESNIGERRVEVLPVHLERILAGVIALMLVLGVIILVSRIQVRRRTRHIRLQNEALQASEQEYREILNSPGDVIAILDAKTGQVMEVNDTVREMYGFDPDEFSNLDFQEYNADEPAYAYESALSKMERAIVEGPQVFEWRSKRKSGELFWVEISLRYSEIRGQERIIAVIRDISRRKQVDEELAAERERLSVTLRSIGDAVITTDLNGRVVLVNRVAESLTGWRQDDAAGRDLDEIFKIVDDETGRPVENAFDRITNADRDTGFGALTLISRNGRRMTVAQSISPIRNRGGRVVGMVLVFRDVTDRLRMEAEILKVKKLESVGVLAGGIAHDFNNILFAILGNLNLAAQIDGPDSETAPLLDDAEKAVLRAEKLTKQLLTFSKGGEPVMEAAAAPGIIRESADFVLRGSPVACSFRFAEDLWLIEADSGQISQVIQNLVLNARDAMPEGGIVEIECSNHPADSRPQPFGPPGRDFVKIAIRDGGVGMPRNLLEKIFDPFFSTKTQGSGLGLAITHSIITKHGGHIFVESEPGEGTEFTLYLPTAPVQDGSKHGSAARLSANAGLKILVMDDDEALRSVMQTMLGHMKHEVVATRNGEESVRAYRDHLGMKAPFDLCILDLTVPGGMGGAEAGQAILGADPGAKIIVASGYSNDPVIANYDDYGFSGALAKPFMLEDLSAVIDSALASAPGA